MSRIFKLTGVIRKSAFGLKLFIAFFAETSSPMGVGSFYTHKTCHKLPRPSNFVSMEPSVFDIGCDGKILCGVVQFITINMMNVLVTLQSSVKVNFHKISMFSNVATRVCRWMIGLIKMFVSLIYHISFRVISSMNNKAGIRTEHSLGVVFWNKLFVTSLARGFRVHGYMLP